MVRDEYIQSTEERTASLSFSGVAIPLRSVADILVVCFAEDKQRIKSEDKTYATSTGECQARPNTTNARLCTKCTRFILEGEAHALIIRNCVDTFTALADPFTSIEGGEQVVRVDCPAISTRRTEKI